MSGGILLLSQNVKQFRKANGTGGDGRGSQLKYRFDIYSERYCNREMPLSIPKYSNFPVFVGPFHPIMIVNLLCAKRRGRNC